LTAAFSSLPLKYRPFGFGENPMENPVDLFSIFILLILAFLAALRIQAFMMKRAISQVIDRFRENNTLCSQGSKSADQLGLKPPTFFERLFKPRDYKPYALQMLIQTGAVLFTDDKEMCLLERRFQEIRQELGMQ